MYICIAVVKNNTMYTCLICTHATVQIVLWNTQPVYSKQLYLLWLQAYTLLPCQELEEKYSIKKKGNFGVFMHSKLVLLMRKFWPLKWIYTHRHAFTRVHYANKLLSKYRFEAFFYAPVCWSKNINLNVIIRTDMSKSSTGFGLGT